LWISIQHGSVIEGVWRLIGNPPHCPLVYSIIIWGEGQHLVKCPPVVFVWSSFSEGQQ